MRNLKKILALVLALVMSFSLVATANAFKDDADVSGDFTEAVEVLSGLKVFEGYEDGSFKPTGLITRAEVAAIIYRIATGDVSDKQVGIYADYNKFADVKSTAWYAGYVNYCANAEYIKGYGDGKFGPEDKVTGYQVLAMILRAVGYDQNGEFTGPGWEIRVASTAKQLGITDNIVAGTLGTAATREMVAEMLFQAIAFVPQVSYTLAFGYQDTVSGKKNATIGYDTFKLAQTKEAYVQWTAAKKIMTVDGIGVGEQDIFDAGRFGYTWVAGTKAITDVFYTDTLLATKYDGVAMNAWTTKGNASYVGALDTAVTYVFNGEFVEADDADMIAAMGKQGVEVSFYDLDSDKKIDTIVVVEQNVTRLTADPAVKNSSVVINNWKFTTATVAGYEDLAKNNVVLYVKMFDGVTYFEKTDSVMGTKTYYYNGAKGEYATVNDVNYGKSELSGSSDYAKLFNTDKTTFETSNYICLDRGGYVVFSTALNASKSYAMVIDSYCTISADHRLPEYYVNMLLTDGTETGYVPVDKTCLAGADYAAVMQATDGGLFPSAYDLDYEYNGLGTLVQFTEKDGVYSLIFTAATKRTAAGIEKIAIRPEDDASLSDDYIKGAAAMEIDEDDYAITTSTVAFYYWQVEFENDKRADSATYYGVDTGKGEIPSYREYADVPYAVYDTDADGDYILNVAVINSDSQHAYTDYAYIFAADGVGTTIDKETIYYYLGVLSDGTVKSFETNDNWDEYVGEVVGYYTNQRNFTSFVPTFSNYCSAELTKDGTTVKLMEEGYDSDTQYVNVNNVYDLTSTKGLKDGDVVDNYSFINRKVQAVVLFEAKLYDAWNPAEISFNESEVKAVFVVDEDVTYGEFTLDNKAFWLPVSTYWAPVKPIQYALTELDDYGADTLYHMNNAATTVKGSDLQTFVAGGVYTTAAHAAMTTGYTAKLEDAVLSADKLTLTVPYTTNLNTVTAAALLNLTVTGGEAAIAWKTTTPAANDKAATLVLTFTPADGKCATVVVEVAVVKAVADYSIVLNQAFTAAVEADPDAVPAVEAADAFTQLTFELSADAQYDVDNGGKVIIYRENVNVYWDSSVGGGEVTTKTVGNYIARAYDAAGVVIAESAPMYVPNDGTVGVAEAIA